MEWQPIETAPIKPFDKEHWYMDGPRMLVARSGHITIAQYGYTKTGRGRWRNSLGVFCPTHWMPLPAPPGDEK